MSKENFSEHLFNEFSKRTKANPKYSLRAFARDLKINDSTLSKIMKGKQTVTKNRIFHLGNRLGLSKKSIENFAKNHSSKSLKSNEIELELEIFNVVSDWYFDAILETLKTNKKPHTPSSISKTLGIGVSLTKIAIKKLRALNLILMDEKGHLTCQKQKTLTSFYEESATTEALKNYQEQILSLSKHALFSRPRKERSHTSHIIAVDSKIIKEINHKIKKFQHDLADFIEIKSKNKDKVYCMQFTNFEIKNPEEDK